MNAVTEELGLALMPTLSSGMGLGFAPSDARRVATWAVLSLAKDDASACVCTEQQ